MCEKYLLGATENRELVFGEFEITHRNGFPEFSASFDTVRPFNCDDVDLTDYFENLIDGMDKAYLYELCERNHCAPQDLPKELADECSDPRDAMDCSLYPEEIRINGDYWYFESRSCGQHDTRNEMSEYTNEEAYLLLHELWDRYHLKNVGRNNEFDSKFDRIIRLLEDIDEKEWIKDYIRRYF